MIAVHNHGPIITSTNYWDTELALQGKLFVSVNAGAIRVLLPRASYGMLNDMRAGKECILSRGPWPAMALAEAAEIMWDDGSDSPFALHLGPNSFDFLPGEPAEGREWVCAVYTAKNGMPHKSLERICHWRRVSYVPYLKAWRV